MNKPRKLMAVLEGERQDVPPVWMMRQAGRYLPEYRQIRKEAGSFLDLCYNPDLATEVTMQPIRRFGFDAAILFSDILVIPDALGQTVRFEEGRGPVLDPLADSDLKMLKPENAESHLKPVIDAVSQIRSVLSEETSLLGFCGAPWTVATYMIAGQSTSDQSPARLFAYRKPAEFESLLKLLSDVSAEYLVRQLQAGADAVQIFDSWSGVLDEDQFEQWCIRPVKRIVDKVRSVVPDAKIIGFPKGAASHYEHYRQKTGVDVLGLDWTVPLDFAAKLQKTGAVQGNLDPLRLIAGGRALEEGVDAILDSLGDGPLVFNLGHGITPDTPIAHVDEMIRRVRGGN